jgi:hypothetical protein
VIMYNCTYPSNELFYEYGSGLGNGTEVFKSESSGLCIDLSSGWNAGSVLVQKACSNDDPWQAWSINMSLRTARSTMAHVTVSPPVLPNVRKIRELGQHPAVKQDKRPGDQNGRRVLYVQRRLRTSLAELRPLIRPRSSRDRFRRSLRCRPGRSW